MRILTVRQPWAWAIIHGGKTVENRVRNIAGDYRGPVAIHVAQADAETAPEWLWLDHAEWYERAKFPQRKPNDFDPAFSDRGHIIGVVDLVDSHPVESCIEQQFVCSEWAERDGHHLVLKNPRALGQSIPYKGALGLRTLDEATVSLIERQLA